MFAVFPSARLSNLIHIDCLLSSNQNSVKKVCLFQNVYPLLYYFIKTKKKGIHLGQIFHSNMQGNDLALPNLDMSASSTHLVMVWFGNLFTFPSSVLPCKTGKQLSTRDCVTVKKKYEILGLY